MTAVGRLAAATLVLGLVFSGTAFAHDHRPPKMVLRSGEARQAGNLGTYCWESKRSGTCVDTSGYGFPRGEIVASGRKARIRIRRDHKPSHESLHAWRHADEEGEPQGDGWGVPHRIHRRTWDGRTVYDIIFRLPKKEGHLYLSLFARWKAREGRFGQGDASYAFHLKLR